MDRLTLVMGLITIRVSLDSSYAPALMSATTAPPRPGNPAETLARTTKIRARCAAASPRITRKMIADETDLSVGTVKNVLSDNAPWDVSDALDKIESAVTSLEQSAG